MDETPIAYAYVAREKCGCIAGAVTEEAAPHCGKDIARWIKEGLVIERVPVETVRLSTWVSGCPHKPKQMELFDEVE